MDVPERKWANGNLKLFPHQHEGVKQMDQWLSNSHGGIMADEMGLGKTAQTVVLLSRLSSKDKGPFLVVAPLSVCDHWTEEVKRFSNSELVPIKYTGYEADRRRVLEETRVTDRTVFITTPHILIKDETIQFLQKIVFSVIVVDEAHCIKNQQTQLARCLRQINRNSNFVLLTGTPIQNNLSELYSLLSFADRNQFPEEEGESFVSKHKSPTGMVQLKSLLAKYMLRRTKGQVFSEELAKCEQVVLYHGVTEIQKELYKNIISKNTDAFQDNNAVKLTNILMQLRKAVIHPYMFQGIEPEPFEEGEHLVEASGKLQVLDRLMRYCFSKGHKCLVFSQFLGALDIVEDFLKLRKWNYERLDGTCRAEERKEKISSFQKNKANEASLCFLLSTKAGGVGLTLTAADTVVFLDSDWNPQNDIQAMARCHRIGQTRAVRVIRLVARFTVDQYVVAKARDKLKLTDDIMGTNDSQLQAADVVSMLRNNFGLLMQADSTSFDSTDSELEKLIGKTKNGEWMPLDQSDGDMLLLNPDECDDEDVDKTDYCNYEGVSYRGKPEEWDRIMESKASENKENLKRKRESKRLREDSLSPLPKRKRQTKEEMWAKKGYVSSNLSLNNERDEDNMNEKDAPLKYVFGDVTRPGKHSRGKDLVLHCVDNGGVFGTGGVFNAIRSLDSSIEEVYETAGKMRDLHLGDAHLCPVDLSSSQGTSSSSASSISVVLLVAQGSTNRRAMKPENLESCLRRVSRFAKKNGYRIHTPRLGKGCDISWYMVDRLLKKHFSLKGIPCFVYYYLPSRKESTPDLDESRVIREQTPEVEIKEQIPDKNVTPSPTKSRRLRRRAKPKSIQKKTEDEMGSDSSEESSAESSASENEWANESDHEEGTDEEIELEDESEDDEEPGDSPEKKRPVKKTKSSVAREEEENDPTVTDGETPKEEEEKEIKAPKSLIIDGVDLSVLFRKKREISEQSMDTDDNEQNFPVFEEEIVSIYSLQGEESVKIRKLVEKHGGTIVSSQTALQKATLVVVPRDVFIDEESLDLFRSHFGKDCHFVHPGFICHAVGTGSLDDLDQFVL